MSSSVWMFVDECLSVFDVCADKEYRRREIMCVCLPSSPPLLYGAGCLAVTSCLCDAYFLLL